MYEAIYWGFPGGAGVKNLPANAGETRDVSLIPGSGRSPRIGNGNPLQYSCLENPMNRGAWRATVYGVAECECACTHARAHTHTHTHYRHCFCALSWGCQWYPSLCLSIAQSTSHFPHPPPEIQLVEGSYYLLEGSKPLLPRGLESSVLPFLVSVVFQ